MLMSPPSAGFNYITGNVLSTRPAAAFGTSITPGNNSFGSYTEILSDTSVTKNCYGILINVNSIAVTATAKDSLTTIGIDTAGGTSYVDFIPNLLTSCAGSYGQGGHYYYFPVFIPAGSALAAKGSVNNATVGTQRVAVWLFGEPNNTENLVYGYGVESIGITGASSSGTAVTSGGAGEGSWTSLGSSTRQWVAFEMGMGINDSSMTAANLYEAELSFGDGTNQVILGSNKTYCIISSGEDFSSRGWVGPRYYPVPSGATLYGRMQCSGTADSSLSMAAYGVY